MTQSLILGTAGHIDHGKTALVRALTGVDTDRLKEEKERGITIDLGFAEWTGGAVQVGIVDVPGHEGFVRTMLAGATGMDVVLMVIAADESVMPQTREHLSIVSLLGVRQLVVALTKVDLVEPEWIELVEDEVRGELASTPFADAPIVRSSSKTGEGLDDLKTTLIAAAAHAGRDAEDDVGRLPVDRVFTVHGTGTVVTGTLWSGSLDVGAQVALEPDGPKARVRGLQVHGRDVERALAGQRTAVALVGAGVERSTVVRGQSLLDTLAWPATHMLTVRLELLPDTTWAVQHNQRLRVHLGTLEALARVVVLEDVEALGPGESGWVQLRLEVPVVARARERFVVRSYSPMTTIGGGAVAEPIAKKRKRLGDDDRNELEAVLDGSPERAIQAVARLEGPAGVLLERLPIVTGIAYGPTRLGVEKMVEEGGAVVGGRLFAEEVVTSVRTLLGEGVDEHHTAHPLRAGASVEALRALLPPLSPPDLADHVLALMEEEALLRVVGGIVSRPGFEPRLTAAQKDMSQALEDLYGEAGWSSPKVEELPERWLGHADLWPLLRLLEGQGVLTQVEDGHFMHSRALTEAIGAVRGLLAGKDGLGPADFREALPLTRKHLIPLLGYFDRQGVTEREGESRRVPS